MIYGNSKVTIAAVKAKDGDGGCFNDEDKIASFKHPVSGMPMAIRKLITHRQYQYHETNETNGRVPLFARAWTLQEVLLAPRVLYFESMEDSFQCRNMTDCQCGMMSKDAYSKTVKRDYEMARLGSSDSGHTLSNWASIMSQYSSRRLTVETDRLPALSGLTKSFMKPDLGAFLAGLWQKDMHLSLTWRSVRPKQARASVYVAPSWSWASTGFEIHYKRSVDAFHMPEYHQSHIAILDVACEPSGLDPTGAVRSGYLRVRGRANSAQLRWDWTVRERSFIQFGPWARVVELDFIPQRLDPDEPFSTLAVKCLLLCSALGRSYFLVLIPGERTGFYERCGIGFGTALYRTKTYEKSGIDQPELKINEQNYLLDGAKDYPIMEWFKDVEEQEMTIV